GEGVYEGLLAEQQAAAERETRKMTDSFAARRRAVERVGLREVREYRLRQLEQEVRDWEALMRDREERLAPEFRALLVVRVRAADEDAASAQPAGTDGAA